ncbi:MAG: nicotinate (nicotinamide) nucleotide adenylyltransferase [Burkholderiales bacterium]|nr:nicotinate (nicotinamide) nucleotide adenylyltransferase [Burkholderiales bacterium]
MIKIFFGGTFDPIHNGHIKLALHINKILNAKVSLMPNSGTPNYKPKPIANENERLAMLKIIADKYSKQIDIELNEIEQKIFSPSVDTLKRLRSKYGNSTPFWFIIGGDSLINLSSWDNWEELFNLTNFIVAMRPKYQISDASISLQNEINSRLCNKISSQAYGQIYLTNFSPIDISSTKIRSNIVAGNVNSLVDRDVYQYIMNNNLYIKK